MDVQPSPFYPPEERTFLTTAEFQANVAIVATAAATGVLNPSIHGDECVFNAVVSLKRASREDLATLTPAWGEVLFKVSRTEECDVARRVLSEDPGSIGQHDDEVRCVVFEHLLFLRERGLPESSWCTPDAFAKLKTLFARHFYETGEMTAAFAVAFGEVPFDPKLVFRSVDARIKLGDTIAINGKPVPGKVILTSLVWNSIGTAKELMVLTA